MKGRHDLACAWIAMSAVAQGCAGLLLATLGETALFAWWHEPISTVLWASPVPPAEVLVYRAWLSAVLGTTMASWGLCAAALAWVPLRRGEAWAWWVIVASLAVWFPLDTFASWRIGHLTNVLVNVSAVAAFTPGLIGAWFGVGRHRVFG